ncbi:MAG: proprotein convertase P-domain-containing protein, partial [Myxococcota bacterium]|nr:proprotein convertase P-domain-containing protein [Myxococcota bacterium]
GQLTNDAGQPGSGNYTLTFALYDASEGGNTLWTEIQPSIEVTGGIFDAQIGSDIDNPLVADTFIDNPQVWLGVTVETGPGVPAGGEPELARQPLTTVGYAFAAQRAVTAATADIALTADSATNAVTAQTAGEADVAHALDCTTCVGTVQLAFDPATQNELDQALANIQIESVDGMGGGTIDGDVVVQGILSAAEIYQGSHQVCDTSGNCGGGGGDVAPDALDDISNNLLTNQFLNNYGSTNAPIAIPDFHPPGVSDIILVPDVGIAQSISVSLNLSNSDLSGVTVKLFAPDGTEYLLFDKDHPGAELGATYPNPTPTLSGDLTEWVDKNPQGSWILNVIDLSFNSGGDDGAINSWSISFQTLSNQQVLATGDLVVAGNLEVSGTINGSSNPTVSLTQQESDCDASNAGELRFNQGVFQYCNSRVWTKVNGATYRWTRFHTYDMSSGWYADNNSDHFGGQNPSNWSDNNACVSSMSDNTQILRRIFHHNGPAIGTVSNSTVWANRTPYTTSTGADHAFALFRIHNSTDSAINWNARFYATAYSGWSNRSSAAINGENLWCSSSDFSPNSQHSLDITIPANRTST